MPAGGFFLSFTGLPSATRARIASLIAHELKQRGWTIETLASQSSARDWISVLGESGSDDAYIRRLRDGAIVLAAINSNTLETPENLRSSFKTFVEVEIGKPMKEQGAECYNAVEDEHLNLTKIVLPQDAEPEKCVADIFSKLEGLELIAGPVFKDSSYDEEDEVMIRNRLDALGYL
jgi:hypothetical protein